MNVMRLILTFTLVLSGASLVSCSGKPQEKQDELLDEAGRKPTPEEQKQFDSAKRNKMGLEITSLQLVNVSTNNVVFRAGIKINGRSFAMNVPAKIGTGEGDVFDAINTVNFDSKMRSFYVLTYRLGRADGAGTNESLGIEFQLSREGEMTDKITTASQFMKIRLDKKSGPASVAKKKFEYPTKSDLVEWSGGD